MYLGLDLGTSSLKAVVSDESQVIMASATEGYAIRAPNDGWAEQDPSDWIKAARRALSKLIVECPSLRNSLRAIGLSGQMHTLVCLDRRQQPLRAAILWNDVRGAGFVTDSATLPSLQKLTGVGAMSSFTAAKLHWLRHAEPSCFSSLHKLMLPKDYLRLWLTGELASEASDAAGTQMFDQAKRDWSPEICDFLGVPWDVMPPLRDSHAIAGHLRRDLAAEFGLPEVPVVTGGGDAATGALGVGCVDERNAIISLGTGSIYLVGSSAYRPASDAGIHVFAHCLPDRWYRMAALLSCGSAIDWVSRLSGFVDAGEAFAAMEARGWSGPGPVMAWPNLDGRRAAGQAAHQRGTLAGLSRATTGLDLVQAMLEGICFSLAEADAALVESGPVPETPTLIGGGARSRLWAGILATALTRPLRIAQDVGAGSALGAVRLAMLGLGVPLSDLAIQPKGVVIDPDPAAVPAVQDRLAEWRRLQGCL